MTTLIETKTSSQPNLKKCVDCGIIASDVQERVDLTASFLGFIEFKNQCLNCQNKYPNN